jgi:hypothetical protein
MEIERLRIENSKLLDKLLITPSIESVTEPAEFKPILPRNVPWNVKRQILESQDREQAKLIKKQNESVSSSANSNQSSNQNKQSIQALEKELGVEDVS